jgi:GDP/UDP-N,N'-diacetylbacillosamine 2-epimerase (hydrolysing)
MKRRICVVTGTRAEYGLLRWTMEGIRAHPRLELQVLVTGMHLSPEFGLTYREIEADGFRIDERVEMLLSSDSPQGLTKSMGVGMIGFADALARLDPDLVLLLGDRFEILSVAAAAMVARIPIAHVHGGETTEGVIDESIRHSITKMSHLHFVAADEYRQRVVQLGEHPGRVFNVGGLGIDNIRKLTLLGRAELEAALQLRFRARNLLVTFHPVTLESATSAKQMQELLAALAALPDTTLILTKPNADTDGRVIIDMLDEFAKRHAHAHVFTSLGQLRYLSCLAQVDAVVGNSSSGLTEAPSFRKATINIGDRQRGRLKADSVIDCAADRDDIARALAQVYTPGFQRLLSGVRNPYGDGGSAERIVAELANVELEGVLKKRFYDLPAAVEPIAVEAGER